MPLQRLKAKRKLSKERRLVRKELVHAAGCVFDCVSKIVACDPKSRAETRFLGVRFPRSLRHLISTSTVPENIHLHLTPEEWEDLAATMKEIASK